MWSVARSRAVNLMLIAIYQGKLCRTWHTTGFMHVNISVRRYFSSFGHTPSCVMKAAQSFIHEAPGHVQCSAGTGYTHIHSKHTHGKGPSTTMIIKYQSV